MNDITYCTTKDCPLRDACPRAKEPQGDDASYADFGNDCEDYWERKEGGGNG